MATVIREIAVPASLGSKQVQIDEIAATYKSVKSAAGSVYAVKIDNTLNTGAPSYVKFYNLAAPTVGTTEPLLVLFAPQGAVVRWAFSPGIAFSTAITVACVTQGGTGGTTNPTNAVNIIVDT